MAAPGQTTPVAAPRRRLVPRGLGRVVGPIRDARGFARVMLYIGAGITVYLMVNLGASLFVTFEMLATFAAFAAGLAAFIASQAAFALDPSCMTTRQAMPAMATPVPTPE